MDASLREFLSFVKSASPFYAELYKDVEISDQTTLQSFPIVHHAAYWAANKTRDNAVRTSPLIDGVIFKTGGTTSKPKATAYSQSELVRTSTQLGAGLVAAGLRPGDRVANLFYAGELWGSFLLHVLSILSSPVPAVHLPISGPARPESYADLLEEFGVTATLSTVTSLVNLANYMLPNNRTLPLVHAVMFAGEALYPDQRVLLQQLFPNATFRSCILGSMDAGVFAESAGNEDARVHRVLQSSVVVELLVSTEEPHGEVIRENGVAGDIVVTSQIRRLTPVVRYPTGDRAEWVDYQAGVFRLLGRSGTSVRLGPVSLDMQDLRRISAQAMSPGTILGLQAVLTREEGKDCLQILIAPGVVDEVGRDTLGQRILDDLWVERPMLPQHIDMGLIGSVRVELVAFEELHVTTRSGKLMAVVDQR